MVRTESIALGKTQVGRRAALVSSVLSLFAVLAMAGAIPTASAQSASGFPYNGLVYTSYQANEYLESPQGAQSAAAMRATGANYASVVVTQYVQTYNANVIAPETTSSPGYNSSADPLTPTDSAVTAAIQNLQAQGLTVFLKPHVDSLDGVFRGSFAPTNVADWFASYQTFILHYAQIAAQNNVGGLVIGTELKSLSGSAYVTYWDNIIAQIRASYPSLTLAYGANATGAGDEFTTVSFWNKVDIIGVDGYFPLTNQANPTVAQLVSAWTDNKNGFNALAALESLQSTYNKPLIFTELGYVSAPGTNEAPYSSAAANATYDPTEQEDCYEAFFEVFSQQTSWMKGVFWWDWNVSPPSANDTGYSPQNKPAGTVTLPRWYGSTTPGFSLAAANSLLTVGQGLSASTIVSVTDQGGFTGAVALAATNLPSGVTAAFAAGSTPGTQVLTLTASGTTATGTSLITVTGTSGAVTAATTLTLNVQAPVAQTVNFANPGGQTVDTPLTLSASATSGLPVTFASTTTNVCTVSNTTASFVAPGTCSLTASQAGDAIYAAASTTQSFTVVGLGAVPVPASADVIVTQVDWLHALTGYVQTSNNPTGGSFGVNSFGEIAVADTNNLYVINPQTGAATTLGAWAGSSAVAVDSKNNIYVGNLYGSPETVVKLPYIGGATNGGYAAFTTPTGSTPACTSSSTTECSMTRLGSIYPSAMAFDAAGDIFWITSSDGATGGNGIWECTLACLAGTGTPVQLYQEPTASVTPSTSSGQLIAGGLAIDPSGNVFFTDSSTYVNASTYAYTSFYSDLNELPTSKGVGYGGATTGYSGAPTVLYTLTPSSISTYNNEVDAVAIDPTHGTVYFADQSDGVFAFPNTGGPIATANGQPTALYSVATQGAKTLALDGSGNLYLGASSTAINTSGADTIAEVRVNNVALPASPVGTPVSTPTYNASNGITSGQVFTVLNDGVSSPTIFLAASEFGASTGEVSATAGAGTSLKVGVAFPVTVTFTPAKPGERSAALIATDTAAGGGASGSATSTGVGQGSLMTVDPGIRTDFTISAGAGGFNPTTIKLDAAGDIFVAGGALLYEIPAGSPAAVLPTVVASGFSAVSDLAFDANGDLYIADSPNVYEIPNVNGSLVPASQVTVVSASTNFGGAPAAQPYALAFGPDGVLYIADSFKGNVDTYDPSSGITSVRVSGLAYVIDNVSPYTVRGIAVDAAGNLYVSTGSYGGGSIADTAALSIYAPGSVTTLSLGVKVPGNVVLDASGSVLLEDQTTGNIFRVPNENGTLNLADAVTIENVMLDDSGVGNSQAIALDANGNLYANCGNEAVCAIQRAGASLTFASQVTAGSSSSPLPVFVEDSGSVALTSLATSTPTGPFTLAAGTPACGATLAAGFLCEDSFTFSPTTGEVGVQSGSATVSSSVASATVTLSGTAAAISSQTITFNNPGTQAAGTPLTLSATASSGLTVTFTSATPTVCTVSNTTATFLIAGTCTIDANQAGDAAYSAAPQVLQSFTVTAAPSFTLAPVSPTLSIAQGSTATDTVNVTGANGFAGSVTLAASGLPTGVTAAFATNPTTGSSVLTLTATGTATLGAATVTITGTSGSLTASATIALTVNVPASFTLAPTSPTLSVVQGSSATDTIAVTGAGGFTGSVTLAATGLPVGVTAAFATNPTTGSSVLTLTATSSATLGAATVTITGTSGSLTASTTIALTVKVPPSFTLAPTAPTLSVVQGSNATDTINVTAAGGFTGSVTLAATGLPTGVTAAFATNPTTGSSVLTLTASGTAATGAATVTITGTSGSLTASTTIALTVNVPASFTLAPTSATLSVVQGASAADTITITGAGGFTGSVTLAATGLPSGVTAAFATNPTTGSSVLTLTAGGTATTGAATVTITGTSGSLTASTTIALTVNVPPGLTLSPTAPTVAVTAPGGTVTDAIAIAATGGFTGTVTLTAAITSSPQGAQDLPALSFGSTSPVTITGPSGGTATLTISTTAATTASLAAPGTHSPWQAAGGGLLACLLLFGLSARRRTLSLTLSMLAILFVLTIGAVGCGGGGGNGGGGGGGGNSGTTAGSYTITVTATSGTASTTIPVTLNVQ